VGVPHAVFFVSDINEWSMAQFEEKGRGLRFHPDFAPEGVNVNAVQLQGKKTLLMRTYERGVEAETLACGTGAAAASFVAWKRGLVSSPSVQVIPRSEIPLQLYWSGEKIEMEGKASFVFEGSIDVEAFAMRAFS
jgi:diaminopimelate epimerase